MPLTVTTTSNLFFKAPTVVRAPVAAPSLASVSVIEPYSPTDFTQGNGLVTGGCDQPPTSQGVRLDINGNPVEVATGGLPSASPFSCKLSHGNIALGLFLLGLTIFASRRN